MACAPDPADSPRPDTASHGQRPSILLVTLDTTRADGMGFESGAVETPSLDALAARGMRFSHAHATAPMTLPSHTSMFTGLLPAAHGVRENGRYVAEGQPLLAALLKEEGYTTAAIVSAFSLASEFGLDRGFDLYDDELGELGLERDAIATTDRALGCLQSGVAEPLFLWVHYFDPHEPYDPPEPFRSRYEDNPYLGEIALMDRELGRLLAEFEARFQGSDTRILVVGDHGQGLGEHGEDLHGKLLYQGVMRVPLIIAGSGVATGKIDRPVSVRRVFHTILGWAGVGESEGLLTGEPEVVMAEALKPYLDYGWQPQVMGIRGHIKVIRSGETEVYDLESDPGESRNLVGQIELDRELLQAISEYPVDRTSAGDERDSLSQEARKKLASLGYIGSESRPTLRQNAPSPKDMTHLFRDLDLGATMFIQEEYAAAIPLFERVLAADPDNLVACLRLAVAHSVLGHEEAAEEYFERAGRLDPGSLDLRYYHAVHLLRFGRWQRAEPLFESVLAEMPRKVGVLRSMVQIRESQGRSDEARGFLRRAMALEEPAAGDFLKLGELSMALMDTPAAIDAFEKARQLQGRDFAHSLELGLCYIANRQVPEAAEALDAVSQFDSEYPFALFKRAQVSVILGEPDREHRIRQAYERADPSTRELMESDPLFRGVALR
jgi:choline-sulfatase